MKNTALYSLFTLFFVSTLLTGCRFGNHADQAQPLKNGDLYKSVDFFFTTPKTFQTRIYLNSLSGPDSVVHTNSAGSLASIPTTILNTLSDPTYLIIPTDPTDTPYFRNNSSDTRLYTALNAAGNVEADSVSEVTTLGDNDCLTQYEIVHEGTFDRTQTGVFTYSDGTQAPVAGSLNFTYTFSRIIQSDNGANHCDAFLSRMGDCYATGVSGGVNCSNIELSNANYLYDIYVKTGVLNIADVTKIKAMEYIVHYE